MSVKLYLTSALSKSSDAFVSQRATRHHWVLGLPPANASAEQKKGVLPYQWFLLSRDRPIVQGITRWLPA